MVKFCGNIVKIKCWSFVKISQRSNVGSSEAIIGVNEVSVKMVMDEIAVFSAPF